MPTDDEQRRIYLGGVLDATARIYPSSIRVSGPPAILAETAKELGGGHFESERRVVFTGRRQRERLLSFWKKHTRYREAEIKEALDSLITRR